MAALTWSPALVLQQDQMDRTHEEFVALLADCDAALAGDDATLLQRWDALVAHTVEHFAQEDRWMVATGFAADNCHSFQHRAVLGVMQGCAQRARGERVDLPGQATDPDAAPEPADCAPLRVAVTELAAWFPQHAQMMDAGLAQHMASIGYDPATGQFSAVAADSCGHGAAAITGCGSAGCATPAAAHVHGDNAAQTPAPPHTEPAASLG